MSNILKSWKTSLIGLVVLGGLAYKAFTVGFSVEDAVFGFIAVGFLASKDANKSHSFNSSIGGEDPDDDDEEADA